MRTRRWMGRLAFGAVLAAAAGSMGCKSLNERYIALEVWKYEKCFGHLPPGFVPPGAQQPAAAAPRVCGQAAPCQAGCQDMSTGCNDCGGGMAGGGGMPGGGMMGGGMMMEGGMPAGASLPTPAGVTAGKPVVISDELVVP
jgi:hypothetical protein